MIRQLKPSELQAQLQQGEKPVILDVRQPWEVNICALPGSTHIPMAEIPARLAELPQDAEIVVLCHHGNRSQHVALFLERSGFDKLSNLAGGIAAWSRDVDPATPTY